MKKPTKHDRTTKNNLEEQTQEVTWKQGENKKKNITWKKQENKTWKNNKTWQKQNIVEKREKAREMRAALDKKTSEKLKRTKNKRNHGYTIYSKRNKI